MTEFDLENRLGQDSEDNLFFRGCNRHALRYLTKEELKVIEELGKTAYVREQEEGRKKRDVNIQKLEAQIGKLDFQPLNVDTFGINDVLRKYGFIFELRYPNSLLYRNDDTNFYACLMREGKPFCKKDGQQFEDYRGRLYRGLLRWTGKIGIEGAAWYLVDEAAYGNEYWAFDDHHNSNYTSSRKDYKRIALLSKSHWKILKEYIGIELDWG